MRRGLALATLDLVLVTLLLAVYGSSRWAWLGGPVSALAIWWLDCSKRPPRGREADRPSSLLVRLGELAGTVQRDTRPLLDHQRVFGITQFEARQLVDCAQRERAEQAQRASVGR